MVRLFILEIYLFFLDYELITARFQLKIWVIWFVARY